jgi:hypothetical protein
MRERFCNEVIIGLNQVFMSLYIIIPQAITLIQLYFRRRDRISSINILRPPLNIGTNNRIDRYHPEATIGPRGFSNVEIIQRATHQDASVSERDYRDYMHRRLGGLFDFRSGQCEGRAVDQTRGSPDLRQRRSTARLKKGRSLLAERLALLRTELSIRYETAFRPNADGSRYRSSLNTRNIRGYISFSAAIVLAISWLK